MQGNPVTSAWPLLLYFVLVLLLVSAMLGLSALLGQRHASKARNQPYESGVLSVGSAQLRLSAKFYLVALFFVIFDLEATFIFAWAVALREAGWAGYIEMIVFIGVLMVSLVYLWRVGALDWSLRSRAREGRDAVVAH